MGELQRQWKNADLVSCINFTQRIFIEIGLIKMLGCYSVRDVSLSPATRRKAIPLEIVEGPLASNHKYTEVKMNSRRKISPEAEKVFNRYTKSPLVRRLNLEEASNMLQKEFGISEEQAPMFFRHFDADCNGQQFMGISAFFQHSWTQNSRHHK